MPDLRPDGHTLVDHLAEQLHEAVLSGALPVGTWLRQRDIAEQYGVSRTPVREAIQILHDRGVVELIPARGARVRGPSAREVREAYLVRAELEGVAADLAATYASHDQIVALKDAEALFSRSVAELAGETTGGDSAGAATWREANNLFHEAILRASANEQLRLAIVALHRSYPRNLTVDRISGDLRLLRENVAQHLAIREAIEEGDGARARRLMVEHVKRSGEIIAARWDE